MKEKVEKKENNIFLSAVSYIRQIIKKSAKDDLAAYAAQITFFVLLSFFPFMILLVILTSRFSFANQNVVTQLLEIVPQELEGAIIPMVNEIVNENSNSYTIVTLIVTLWSSSKGLHTVIRGLEKIYGVEGNSNYFRLRLASVVYTLMFMLMCMAALALNVFSKAITGVILSLNSRLANTTLLIMSLRSLFFYIILFVMFLMLYYQLPRRKTKLSKEWVGAAISAILWLLMTKGFSLYIRYIALKSRMYGSLTTMILIIVWLYIGMQIMLYGAEINWFMQKADSEETDNAQAG